MNLKTFKKIYRQVEKLEQNNIKFDVRIVGDNEWTVGSETASFEPIHYEVGTLKQLSDIQLILQRPIKLKDNYNKVKIVGLDPVQCTQPVQALVATFATKPGERMKHPTLKFYSDYARTHITYDFAIFAITEAPTEQTEDDVTYRFIGNKEECTFCIPHTHELYNYLDKGFFFQKVRMVTGKERYIITNELTLDVYLVMLLVHMNPAFIKYLKDSVFLNANTAKLLRIKMEKELVNKGNYERARDVALKEWEKAANSDIIRKLAEGKLAHTTYNHIKLTKTTATYETVVIEAPDLVDVIQSRIIFDDRTDIYTIVRGYINYVIEQLEAEDLAVAADAKKAKIAEYNFSINGINVRLKRTSENTRRYVNDVMINKAEVEDVSYRASCFEKQADFDKFVRSVHKLSLKWHDALANGLGVKIHDGMTTTEYKNSSAPLSAPRIRFKQEDGDFKLVLGEDKAIKIHFNDIQKKIATLNRKTNNGYGGGYEQHNAAWARRQLVGILKECCTFDKKTTVTKQVQSVVDNVAIYDKDGKPVMIESKEVIKTPECLLTDEDAAFMEKAAREYQQRAIEKSKVALQLALQRTGAKLIQFKGAEGYLVEGQLRKYVVLKDTNQVFNYEQGNYICIVEPGHQVSVGFDALAARLYALKNDSVMVKQIGTLAHG